MVLFNVQQVHGLQVHVHTLETFTKTTLSSLVHMKFKVVIIFECDDFANRHAYIHSEFTFKTTE